MENLKNILLLIQPKRKYTFGLIQGFTEYAKSCAHDWAICRSFDYRNSERNSHLMDMVHSKMVQGVFLREPENLEEYVKSGIPIISAPYSKRKINDVINIVADHKAIGEMGAKHMLERGFKHFAFCGFNEWWWSLERELGYSQAIIDAGYDIRFYTPPLNNSHAAWFEEPTLIAQWLESLPKPVAIMACNDDRAAQLVEASKIAGMRVPDDVAILGVGNDITLCDTSYPPISSIQLDLEKSGYEAAQKLANWINGKKDEDNLVSIQPVKVIVRQSSNILTVQDETVAQAVKYIHQHNQKALKVDQVARAVAISRRQLEKKFRRELDRSVHFEIKQARILRIRKLLVESDMTITEIACQLDFPDVAHISRYFRDMVGMTPLEFRKEHTCKKL